MTEPLRYSKDGISITNATPENIPVIKDMVHAAYSKYIERIGKPPAPMTADYRVLMQTHEIFLLQKPNGKVMGSIMLRSDLPSNSIEINNLVVDPLAQGLGYGRILMSYAENIAKARGHSSLTLYTNVKMYENLGLYVKLGFTEMERKVEDGFERVYFRKPLH
ncbi:pre-mRNA splicing factor [Penicillium atrosanguineum]|uniref:pre-mRNA splicing factor n=1 Tax=Penicillium atrosanguineum TaxID=1132637 RepID=UPI00239A1FAD|nr:pre-mRNA splicing factor [Penicillium atrosanguineum]KAJ5314061.1 pre-mRNA splicing factor [Penicillium atrosanguineum]